MKRLLLAFMVVIGFAEQATAGVYEMIYDLALMYGSAGQKCKQEQQLMYEQELQQMYEEECRPMGRKMRRDFSYKRILQGYERKLQQEESKRATLAPILQRNRE